MDMVVFIYVLLIFGVVFVCEDIFVVDIDEIVEDCDVFVFDVVCCFCIWILWKGFFCIIFCCIWFDKCFIFFVKFARDDEVMLERDDLFDGVGGVLDVILVDDILLVIEFDIGGGS